MKRRKRGRSWGKERKKNSRRSMESIRRRRRKR